MAVFSLQQVKFTNSEHVGAYEEIMVPYGKRQADVRVKIHYIEKGTGEPLLLLHSVGQSAYTWRKIIDELAEKYRVIAVDLPGHGYSNCLPYATYSMDEHTEMLRRFVNGVAETKLNIVAFSFGCGIAVQYVKRFPSQVKSLTLLSPGGLTDDMPLRLRMMGNPIFGAISAATLKQSAIKSMLEECFLDLTMLTDDMIDQYCKPLISMEARRAMWQTIRCYDDALVLSDTESIDIPTLIVAASEDKWHDDEICRAYKNSIKGADLVTIRNAGHLLHEEQPKKVVSTITQMIDGLNNNQAEE